MSDAMTNPEIEDVVSSIRRLVSEDVRPTARSEADVQEVGKFVLTPALRVADTVEEQSASDENAPETHAHEAQHLQDEGAHDAPHHDASHNDAPHDGGEHHHEDHAHEPTDESHEHMTDGAQDDAWSTPQEHDAAQIEETEASDHSDTLVLEGAERIQDDAQDAQEHTDDAQQDHSNDHRNDLNGDSADENSDDHVEETAAAPTDEEAQDWQDEAQNSQSLEDRIADLEAAVGAQPDEWEPDGSEEETSAGPSATILQYSQSGFGAGAASLSAAFDDPNADPELRDGESFDANDFGDEEDDLVDLVTAAAIATNEDAILDEAALRELVGVIVREELQGALGERITRNVRRLVRREVQRALSLREFD